MGTRVATFLHLLAPIGGSAMVASLPPTRHQDTARLLRIARHRALRWFQPPIRVVRHHDARPTEQTSSERDEKNSPRVRRVTA
jgi:hypothetical protein